MSEPFPHKSVRDARRQRSQGIQPSAVGVSPPDPSRDKKAEEIALAKMFRNVYATPAGEKVLEHIMSNLCQIDIPIAAASHSTEHMVAIATSRDLGGEIHRLITMNIEPPKEAPQVITRKPPIDPSQ